MSGDRRRLIKGALGATLVAGTLNFVPRVARASWKDSRLKPHQKLQRFWAATDSDIPTATLGENDLFAIEARYGVRLPSDFREYLLRLCPNDDTAMDRHYTGWWPLARITTVAQEYGHDTENPAVSANAGKYLFFADAYIWYWAWAIACGGDENYGRIAVIGIDRDRFVANSFSEFIGRYIDDVSLLE